MSRRDEVVEAMAEAMDTAYNPDRYPIMAAMFRDYADAGLDAALAVLQPVVPNEVEALNALPVGTVLRGVDQDGGVWIAWQADHGWWHDGTYKRVDEWLVIYQPEEES